jgi:hypothetical protein
LRLSSNLAKKVIILYYDIKNSLASWKTDETHARVHGAAREVDSGVKGDSGIGLPMVNVMESTLEWTPEVRL